MQLAEILTTDPLAAASRTLAKRPLNERLSDYLTENTDPRVLGALVPFVDQAPLRYWDDSTVRMALTVLEKSNQRTSEALGFWRDRVGRGIENVFRQAPTTGYEGSLQHTHARDLVRLATEFHPEYLRIGEHVFGNLIVLYRAILRKGGVDGKFDLGGGVKVLREAGFSELATGYDDAVRNAIAHGEVVFTGMHIRYAPRIEYEWTASEFLKAFDQLVRTSNGLALAIFLYTMRKRGNGSLDSVLPLQLKVRIAAGRIERPGLRVIGSVESETRRVGKQLHVAVETACRQRAATMVDCARVGVALIEAGAHDYSRFAIEMDQGASVRSLAFLLPARLSELVRSDAGIERLREAFGDPLLLWLDEPAWRWKLRAGRFILSGAVRAYSEDVTNRWHALGIRRGRGRFRVRDIENRSVSGIARLDICAVLRDPRHANDRDLINEVLRELVIWGRRRWLNSSPSELDGRMKWRKRPSYVWVNLYRQDGTIRWLRGGGWPEGNLIAVAEWVARGRPPIVVKNPQELVRGLRIRYEMDSAAFGKAVAGLAKIITEIRNDTES